MIKFLFVRVIDCTNYVLESTKRIRNIHLSNYLLFNKLGIRSWKVSLSAYLIDLEGVMVVI